LLACPPLCINKSCSILIAFSSSSPFAFGGGGGEAESDTEWYKQTMHTESCFVLYIQEQEIGILPKGFLDPPTPVVQSIWKRKKKSGQRGE
jgi:hypothetical protein